MALGRQGERQAELMVGWAELPRSPGHAFYDRLQAVLVEAGFDRFAESECAPYYAAGRGRPSLPPGRYFRMHPVGYFEGIDSERGLEWRCASCSTPWRPSPRRAPPSGASLRPSTSTTARSRGAGPSTP